MDYHGFETLVRANLIFKLIYKFIKLPILRTHVFQTSIFARLNPSHLIEGDINVNEGRNALPESGFSIWPPGPIPYLFASGLYV